MTTTAVGAELAIMYVVSAMTVSATAVDSLDFVERHAVAIVTGDGDMCAFERKFGLCVVIE